MGKNNRIFWITLCTVIGILAAALSSAVTFALCMGTEGSGKLWQLQTLISQRFIGEEDVEAMEDAAANAMVEALPDRWSFYIPASQMQAYNEQKNNAYVGIGVTISLREDGAGFDVTKVEPGGPAAEAGVLPGDILFEAEGQQLAPLGTTGARELVRGEEGSQVQVAVLRDGQRLDMTLTLRKIRVAVATGQMLEGKIGYVAIANFNDNCAAETIARIEELLEQGAKALIFDVRGNPGGYKSELVKLLDYLLPKGDLFTSLYYDGSKTTDTSDKNCLQIPMAVLINSESYSAAEFFAAALAEYDWAVLVGENTVGKGYFQQTYELKDGSGVALSVGKYFTPKGVCLGDTGGLTPQVPVEVDSQTAALIYSKQLEVMEDPQVLAAIEALAS